MSKKLSVFLDRFIPQFVTEDNPQFVVFIKRYLNYLERDLGEYDLIVNLLDHLDIDNTRNEYLKEFKKKYISDFPESFEVETQLLIKKVRDFYQNRGNEESYRFLFHAVYDRDIEFYYPKVDILRVSDGKWKQPYEILTNNTLGECTALIDKFIEGSVSGAKGFAASIVYKEDPENAGSYVHGISIINREGVFSESDVIREQGTTSPVLNVISSGIIVGVGSYEGTDGHISSDKKIQDNHYYQDYSYVLKVEISRDNYEGLVKEIVHPAGMKMFTEVSAPDYTRINLGDNIDYWYYTLAWLNLENNENTVSFNESELQKNIYSIDGYDWIYFQENIEEASFVSLFPTPDYFDNISPDDFDMRSSKYSSLLFLDGKKVRWSEYDISNNRLTFVSGNPSVGTYHLVTLNHPITHMDEFAGDSTTTVFSKYFSNTQDLDHTQIWNDGSISERTTDYTVTDNNVTIPTPIDTGKYAEALYLGNNYSGISPKIYTTTESGNVIALDDRPSDIDNLIVSYDGTVLIPRIDFYLDGLNIVLKNITMTVGKKVIVEYINNDNRLVQVFNTDGTETELHLDNILDIFEYSSSSSIEII